MGRVAELVSGQRQLFAATNNQARLRTRIDHIDSLCVLALEHVEVLSRLITVVHKGCQILTNSHRRIHNVFKPHWSNKQTKSV